MESGLQIQWPQVNLPGGRPISKKGWWCDKLPDAFTGIRAAQLAIFFGVKIYDSFRALVAMIHYDSLIAWSVAPPWYERLRYDSAMIQY